jgi:hypothetical protein
MSNTTTIEEKPKEGHPNQEDVRQKIELAQQKVKVKKSFSQQEQILLLNKWFKK